jgi:hypothetical protein
VTEVSELIDPDGVDDRPDKWGFITRLKHLDDMVEDPNDNPFELFKKEDHEQFSLDIKEITIDGEMPEGIGIWDEIIDEISQTGSTSRSTTRSITRSTSLKREWILIDPMTKETISRESVLDEDGKPVLYRGQPVHKVNDHWFVLNAKFVWRDAPEPPKSATPQLGQYGSMASRRPGMSTGSSGVE